MPRNKTARENSGIRLSVENAEIFAQDPLKESFERDYISSFNPASHKVSTSGYLKIASAYHRYRFIKCHIINGTEGGRERIRLPSIDVVQRRFLKASQPKIAKIAPSIDD